MRKRSKSTPSGNIREQREEDEQTENNGGKWIIKHILRMESGKRGQYERKKEKRKHGEKTKVKEKKKIAMRTRLNPTGNVNVKGVAKQNGEYKNGSMYNRRR